MRALLSAVSAAAIAVSATQPAGAQPSSGEPAFNWTSLYLGIAGGGGLGSTKHTNEAGGGNSGNSSGLNGGIVGGTYGYNWQIDPSWLLGFEGDISWSPIFDKFNNSGFCGTPPVGCVTKLEWLGTDRLRVGFLTGDDWLFYVTGGVAYGDVKAGIPGDGCCTEETHTRVGYAAGAGVETPIAPALSLKLEYLFVDLGHETNYRQIAGAAESVSAHVNVLRVGLDYEIEP